MDSLPGMVWKTDKDGDPIPYWEVKVAQESIIDLINSLFPNTKFFVWHLGGGSFNQVFVIFFTDHRTLDELIVRVALPIEPRWKVISEVSTINYLRAKTTIPVPNVVAYCADRRSKNNPIDYEWMIMERIEGLRSIPLWYDIDMEAKENFVKELAGYTSELFNLKFKGIGNLYADIPIEKLDISDQEPISSEKKLVGHTGTQCDSTEHPTTSDGNPAGCEENQPGSNGNAPECDNRARVSIGKKMGHLYWTYGQKQTTTDTIRGPFRTSREFLAGYLAILNNHFGDEYYRLAQKKLNGEAEEKGSESGGGANTEKAEKAGHGAQDPPGDGSGGAGKDKSTSEVLVEIGEDGEDEEADDVYSNSDSDVSSPYSRFF